jgi:hypothetical protein
MKRRWTAEKIMRLLKEVDRDLAKKLTVTDICRKLRRVSGATTDRSSFARHC